VNSRCREPVLPSIVVFNSLAAKRQWREHYAMDSRVALDVDVVRLLVDGLNWRDGPAPEAETVAVVRVYFYITNPLLTPTVAAEVQQENERRLSHWKSYHFEEIAAPDDFYRGCVKGMAERYVDYHPDPRDCRVVAEAECAKVEALLTLDAELVRGLSGRSEVISVVSPSEYWRTVNLPHGATPRTTPTEGNPLLNANWWHW